MGAPDPVLNSERDPEPGATQMSHEGAPPTSSVPVMSNNIFFSLHDEFP